MTATYNPAELRVQVLLALPDIGLEEGAAPGHGAQSTHRPLTGYEPAALAEWLLERAADAYQAGVLAGATHAQQPLVDLAAAAGTVGTSAEVAIYLDRLVTALKATMTPNDQWSLGRSVAVERDRLLAHCAGILAEFPALSEVGPRLAAEGLALPGK